MRPMKMVGMVCLIGSAALFAACQPSPQTDAAVNRQEPPKLEAEKPGQKQSPAKAGQAKKAIAKATPAKAGQDAVPASASASAPVMESRAVASRQEEPIATTITGCLERDGDTFQMKDTSGENTPKARSWKSGFIKKSSAKIDLLDTTNRLKLAPHVGYRVSVTGDLVDREMHARSLRPTSERCD